MISVPILASLNLRESAQFYVEKLGFAQVLLIENYLILRRGGAELQFWLCSDPQIAANTACYIRTEDIELLYQEFAARGVEMKPPVLQPWGMVEMYLLDPHGNLLKFGQSNG
ncbi:MAG TPA: VOC family protein [Pseudomonadales bacterium]|nr:VOC family protein [Pseudomonadales bacterium]